MFCSNFQTWLILLLYTGWKTNQKPGFSKGCNQTDSDIDKYINKQEKAKKNKKKKKNHYEIETITICIQAIHIRNILSNDKLNAFRMYTKRMLCNLHKLCTSLTEFPYAQHKTTFTARKEKNYRSFAARISRQTINEHIYHKKLNPRLKICSPSVCLPACVLVVSKVRIERNAVK